MDLKLVAVSILLVLFCSEVSSYRLQKREAEEPELFAQVKEKVTGAWEQVSSTAQGWLAKIQNLEVTKPIINMYENSVSRIKTYTDILSDQVYHLLQSES
uniref:apolipoprotein C-II-like n=1 Tax=Podarcis muralis TaxID=64176 RepID=UPI0010A03F31|nr:apolipoprotein C-II-like [Podarcis muralis]XP_028598044.1 apolipoprotein C-II-like [Podarcis muralis]XP_028598045.1 apolipoprotein C-II-like [Podarcis muralis]